MTSKHNLPRELTTFVGREREIAELDRLTASAPLITFTGAGGAGKTRLATRIAVRLAENEYFSDGIFFVSLVSVKDPELIIPTIARTLGVKESGGKDLITTLVDFVADRSILLLLDNFEQLLGPQPDLSQAPTIVADLLMSCPRLQMVITSRTALRLYGEQEYPVQPLSLPESLQAPRETGSSAAATSHRVQSDAVTLFVQRVQAVKPDFALAEQTAPLVEAICRRLDGLPLAIELAAARMRGLSLPSILSRLENRLDLLVDGARNLPVRHQTLRDTISWSYELLSQSEQILFRRLCVFTGGFTLEAAEAVADFDADYEGQTTKDDGRRVQSAIAEGIQSLLLKSLLKQDDPEGEARLTMLETIREFAYARLVETGELFEARSCHMRFFTRLAEEGESGLMQGDEELWLRRLEREHDNFNAALDWGLNQPGMSRAPSRRRSQERENLEGRLQVFRLAGALGRFWHMYGKMSEGKRWLARALELVPNLPATPPELRAKLLYFAGLLSIGLGDYEEARLMLDESLALWRDIGDSVRIAMVLKNLGTIEYFQGNNEPARLRYEESLALERDLGNPRAIAGLLYNLGLLASVQGDYREAIRLTKAAIDTWRSVGEKYHAALSLSGLGVMLANLGEYHEANIHMQEALAIKRELGDKRGIAHVLITLALSADAQGEWDKAAAHYEESLALYLEVGHRLGVANALWGLATVAYQGGNYPRAEALHRESLVIKESLSARNEYADSLIGLAAIAAAFGKPERAAVLFGAAEVLRETLHSSLPPVEQARYDRMVAAVREQTTLTKWDAAWQRGREMPLDEVLALAVEPVTPPPAAPTPAHATAPAQEPADGRSYPTGLTKREVEILRLVATGLTDAQVAERLFLSTQTVHTHLRNIYSKLGVANRMEASRFAAEHNLT